MHRPFLSCYFGELSDARQSEWLEEEEEELSPMRRMVASSVALTLRFATCPLSLRRLGVVSLCCVGLHMEGKKE